MKKLVMLVTGATGFIGRNIFDHFRKDPQFHVYGTHFRSRGKRQRTRQIDLVDEGNAENLIRDVQPDILIHAAAVTSGAKDIVERPWIHVSNNLIMNSHVLEAAYEHGVGHVIFPSCTVLYPSGMGRALREEDVDQNNYFPQYQGGATVKVAAEGLAKFYASLGKTRYTVLRHSNVYGPHDKFDLEKSHVTGATITKVMQAEDGGVVEMWGNPDIRRDLIYIDDMVRAVELVVSSSAMLPKYSVFNIGRGGVGYTIETIALEVAIASAKQVQFKWDNSKPSIPFDIQLDITHAREQLGWSPKISLSSGLTRTTSWYTKNIARA